MNESMPSDELDPKLIRRRTRRAFLGLGLGTVGGYAGWSWLRSRSTLDGIPWPLRRIHQSNEVVGRAIFSHGNLAPEFAADQAQEPRVNGHNGEPENLAESVSVTFPDGTTKTYTWDELFAGLTRIETITELKCIEGWSTIVRWGGYRFSDVAAKHNWPMEVPYIGMSTSNDGYYVGLDRESATHPQTIFCDRLDGQPLTRGHGAPVRLVLPVKYGIKNIKWLAHITFTTTRPADYWAERGYDWYAGL